MTDVRDQTANDFDEYVRQDEHKGMLRFITCGSVDDGKSTLLGRLLYDSRTLFEDQIASLVADSRRVGTRGGEVDYALLLDGLSAEREQGITIDVAYRFFSTHRRKFIAADTPGHEQYTRNMVTGASTADLAIMLIDARKGILSQTRRHSHLVSLLGIRRMVLAINKMDLVDYSFDVFASIDAAYREFGSHIALTDITSIPISAVHGDNVLAPLGKTPWYQGPSLLEFLETVPLDDSLASRPFRMPVQWVNRPSPDFRGFAGTVVCGTIRRGDRIRALPSGHESIVAGIVGPSGPLPEAVAHQAITLTLSDEIDISRGDVITAGHDPAGMASQFEAVLVWMGEAPLLPGRNYLMKVGAKTVMATVTPLKYKLDVNTLEHMVATSLAMNEIGVVQIELDQIIVFEPYERSRDLGGFILVDRLSNQTVAAGLLRFALRRSQNISWQATDVDRAARALIKGQKPCVLWLTGLSGSGKSTIANLVEKRLHAMGRHTYLLDGDNVRHGINKDLGFTEVARVENIRRVAEIARLMADAGLIVLVAFISPFRSERLTARRLLPEGEFLEIFVDASLELAEARDPKGLYKKARAGLLQNFTGIDSPYEPPTDPELWIDTASMSAEAAAKKIIVELADRRLAD